MVEKISLFVLASGFEGLKVVTVISVNMFYYYVMLLLLLC